MSDNEKPTIPFDTFAKVKLRTGKVLVAEQHPNADTLLRLEIEVGDETRQICAGIASTHKPEDLIGKTVIVVANLKPAKFRGVESQGMLLAAVGDGDESHLLTVEGSIESGAEVS